MSRHLGCGSSSICYLHASCACLTAGHRFGRWFGALLRPALSPNGARENIESPHQDACKERSKLSHSIIGSKINRSYIVYTRVLDRGKLHLTILFSVTNPSKTITRLFSSTHPEMSNCPFFHPLFSITHPDSPSYFGSPLFFCPSIP